MRMLWPWSALEADTEHAHRHKSIIAYLIANDLPETAATLRKELAIAEDSLDAATVKKYETLLEKKWTSTVRLQKKVSQECGSPATLYTSTRCIP